MSRGCACAGEQRGAGLGHWAAGHGTRRDAGLHAGPGRGLHGGHNRDPFGHREAAAAMPVLQALDAGAQSAGAGSGAVGLGQRREFGPMARGEGRAHDRKRNLQWWSSPEAKEKTRKVVNG